MEINIFDSELKVLEVLWKEGDLTAGQLSAILKKQTGWNRNTTYTVIGRLIAKGAIERYDSNFFCKAIITKEQVQRHEATELVNKLFDGSAARFLSLFLNGKELSESEIRRLKQIVDELEPMCR
ncbi:MAG: BlaI/MecI/CopY family transcriptional regulator [Oscillospiraceae bacterium]|nr:BlaI/MecI/CopY family transcriptional regulator [Oscillospiraceae bacterium]